MQRVFGYCRVSTTRQAEEGESLDVQRRQIEGYVQMKGLPPAEILVEEGVSGSIPVQDRPVGGALLKRLQAGDVLISPKLDRLFRSALDSLQCVEDLRQRKVQLHLLDLGGDISGNGLAKVFLTIASAFAEAERDRIRERVQAAKDYGRARGMHLGGSRQFGFDIAEGGQLVPNAAEQRAIKKMRRLRKQGHSLRDIADTLNADGFQISHAGVNRVIKRAI
jgi:putative DNA-invertase from lambdoid prophage Rac